MMVNVIINKQSNSLQFSKTYRIFALGINKYEIEMAKETKTSKPQKKEKKVNKTWEAFGKWKGAFTILDPKFLL